MLGQRPYAREEESGKKQEEGNKGKGGVITRTEEEMVRWYL